MSVYNAIIEVPFFWFEPKGYCKPTFTRDEFLSRYSGVNSFTATNFRVCFEKILQRRSSRETPRKYLKFVCSIWTIKKTKSHASMQPALFGYFCISSLKSNINFIHKFPPHRIRTRVFFPLSINEKLKGEEVQSFIPLAQ